MKLKKGLSITLILVMVLIILTAGYFGIIRNSYKNISEDTKGKINVIIKDSRGETPDLQTESCRASWIEDAHIKQKEMMDKVLNTLTVLGESRKGKPNKYIFGTYENMKLYIPYNEKSPESSIIIEVDNHYYVATANEDDVRTIVNYMKKQKVLE